MSDIYLKYKVRMKLCFPEGVTYTKGELEHLILEHTENEDPERRYVKISPLVKTHIGQLHKKVEYCGKELRVERIEIDGEELYATVSVLNNKAAICCGVYQKQHPEVFGLQAIVTQSLEGPVIKTILFSYISG